MSIRQRSHARKPLTHLTENADLIELWLLRILIPLQKHREFLYRHTFSDDVVAYTLGLESLDKDDDSFDKKSILKMLRARHNHAGPQRGTSETRR